jgi:hypothetical protein
MWNPSFHFVMIGCRQYATRTTLDQITHRLSIEFNVRNTSQIKLNGIILYVSIQRSIFIKEAFNTNFIHYLEEDRELYYMAKYGPSRDLINTYPPLETFLLDLWCIVNETQEINNVSLNSVLSLLLKCFVLSMINENVYSVQVVFRF